MKLYTVVVHNLQMCMKEYRCCLKFQSLNIIVLLGDLIREVQFINTVLYYLTSSEICPDKRGDLIREVQFINAVLYYLTSSEICPDKRGDLIREGLL